MVHSSFNYEEPVFMKETDKFILENNNHIGRQQILKFVWYAHMWIKI